ncbi:MAG: SH3 domain-containing protein [Phototrophicaceae bacterium]
MPRWHHILFIVLLMLLSSVLVLAQDGNANVIDMAESLNIRSAPSGRADIVGDVAGNTSITVIGRNASNQWYQITVNGITGWVASGFVDLRVARATIPIVDAALPAAPASSSAETTTTTTTSAPAGDTVASGTINVVAANIRASDNTRSAIIAELSRGTVVNVIARNATSTWIQIEFDGQVGWIFANLISLNVSRGSLPSIAATVITTTSSNTDNTSSVEAVQAAIPAGDAPYFTLGASARNIFAAGQALGNRANVFSKIGDSITVDEGVFTPFGFGVFNLGDYGYLRSTISFFSAQARNNNSFNNTSLAAGNGYTTRTILDTNFANRSVCELGESPLACEYRLTRPAVALILIGTNDTNMVPIDEYAANLQFIVDYSINQGVIPVLNTLPPRMSFPGRAESYNDVIIRIASARGLPLIDFYSALVVLPDSGMNDDGIHPSSPPLRFEQAGDFRGNNLLYGYTIRNLTTLQALHSLRINVLQ